MIQLPDTTADYVAIQKSGQKVHLALGSRDGHAVTSGRALCDYRVTAGTVTGARERSTVCERCLDSGPGDLFVEVAA